MNSLKLLAFLGLYDLYNSNTRGALLKYRYSTIYANVV